MRAPVWRISVALLFLAGLAGGQTNPQTSTRATLSGRIITLHPSGANLEIPADWITWYGNFHNNLHLSSSELDSVRVAIGEWDTEYAQIVNSTLPFQDCVAHLGGDGWGKDGSSFADVQLRIYATLLSEAQLRHSVAAQGLSAARQISSDASVDPPVKVGPWQRTTLRYSLFYGDYGGTARVDFYTRSDHGQTFVLVFMFCDSNRFGAIDQVAAILSSFRLVTDGPKHKR